MKKFNSILAIAVVALTSVFGFTSCDKNDDALYSSTKVIKGFPTPTSDPKPEVKVGEYKFFASDATLALGDFEVVVEYNGEKTTNMVSQGTSEVKYCMVPSTDGGLDEKVRITGKVITISDVKEGSIVTPTFIPNIAAIEALPSEGTTDIIANGSVNNITYLYSLEHGKIDMNYTKYGVQNSQVMDYITSRLANASTVIDL